MAQLLHLFTHSINIGKVKELGGRLILHGGVGWCRSASHVVLYYRFEIAIGSEHLSEVLDLLPSLSFFTHLLRSDLQTLHNSSENFGNMVGVNIDGIITCDVLQQCELASLVK